MASRTTNQAISGILKYYYDRWLGPATSVLHDIRNNIPLSFADSTDTISVHGMSVDVDSRVRVHQAALLGAREPFNFYLKAAGALVTQTLLIADRPMVITGILESHGTAETATGTATLAIFKDTGINAPGGGATTMTNTINLKGTANTVQTGTLLAVTADGEPNAGIVLATGDRLSIVVGGTATITALAGVSLTVYFAPGFKEVPAIYNAATATIATQNFFLSNRDYLIIGAQAIWSVKGTSPVIDITTETSTTAAGSGTSILSATIDGSTVANTVNVAALTATAATLRLAAGQRLSVKISGTTTGLAGLVVIVYLQAVGTSAAYQAVGTGLGYIGQVDVNYTLLANTNQGTTSFFIADRDYEVVDTSLIWGTAGSDGGTVSGDFQIDKGTTAPGSGTSATTGALSVKTTAATATVIPISTSRRVRLMSQGDRLTFVTAGTLTALAGVTGSVSLLPR